MWKTVFQTETQGRNFIRSITSFCYMENFPWKKENCFFWDHPIVGRQAGFALSKVKRTWFFIIFITVYAIHVRLVGPLWVVCAQLNKRVHTTLVAMFRYNCLQSLLIMKVISQLFIVIDVDSVPSVDSWQVLCGSQMLQLFLFPMETYFVLICCIWFIHIWG